MLASVNRQPDRTQRLARTGMTCPPLSPSIWC